MERKSYSHEAKCSNGMEASTGLIQKSEKKKWAKPALSKLNSGRIAVDVGTKGCTACPEIAGLYGNS